jgi:hypothetical protein
MTNATIQIKQETKDALVQLKTRLEKSLGRSLSFNDIILHLLKTRASFSDRHNLESLRELRGLLGSEDADAYRQEKLHDLAREEN